MQAVAAELSGYAGKFRRLEIEPPKSSFCDVLPEVRPVISGKLLMKDIKANLV